jgi:hypothetical protein
MVSPPPPSNVQVVPVTSASWDAFEALFSARGAPHFCWCSTYRVTGPNHAPSGERKERMRHLVDSGTPVGVLALQEGEPVGWCSVAPRETYVKLQRSRTMPRVSDAPLWTVLCFFIPRTQRGKGLSLALLNGAVHYAQAHGAVEVEGYPFDTAGISATHRGPSGVFAQAGFRQEGTRWVLNGKVGPAGARNR